MNYFISSSSYGHSDCAEHGYHAKKEGYPLVPLFIRHILSFIRQFGHSIHLEPFYHAEKEGYPLDSSFYPSHFEFYPPVWTFYPLRAILSPKKRRLSARFLFLSVTF